jgi:phasin family protein
MLTRARSPPLPQRFVESFNAEDIMHSFANTPALQSHLETQVNFFTELAHRSYDSARKLSELNLRLAQQLIENSVDTGRQMLTCSDPYQATAMAVRQFEPVAHYLRSYQQQLLGLLAGAQVELTRAAETHLPEAGRSAAAVAEEIARRGAEVTDAFTSRQRSAAESMSSTWSGPNGSQGKPH